MASEEDSASDLSSDEELQVGLAQGTLKPGLIGKVAPPRTFTNNVSGLREKLSALKRKGQTDWLERMDITCATVPQSSSVVGEEGDRENDDVDPNDDFKREMWFYQQAQSAVAIGWRKLQELDIPTTRPDDYFAEMIKTDDHMRKVRERLLSRQKGLEQREKARKLRDLKKFGKKVQQDILQKRREEKKQLMKKFNKKGRDKKSELLQEQGRGAEREEEEFAVSAARESEHRKQGEKRGGSARGKSKKRQFKDKKFGFGGRKHVQKRNSATSAADMSGFSSARHSKSAKTRKNRGNRGRK